MADPIPEPTVIEQPDLEPLRKACEGYLSFVKSDDYNDDAAGDHWHFIYEVALATVYGPNVFEFVNAKTRGK